MEPQSKCDWPGRNNTNISLITTAGLHTGEGYSSGNHPKYTERKSLWRILPTRAANRQPGSLVVADVSEDPDAISPLWTFKSHTKYSSPFHLLTFLSAYRQTLAWSSFSWNEANQNALCVMLLVCVYITSSSGADVSHPKCRSHRVTPKSDKGVARVCFPSCRNPMVGMHVPSPSLISIP